MYVRLAMLCGFVQNEFCIFNEKTQFYMSSYIQIELQFLHVLSFYYE